MLSDDAAKEIAKFNTCKSETQSLRDRFESDFGRFRNEAFAMPAVEGKWDSFTSNRPSTTADKIINTLAASRLRLWIPLTDENKKQRKHLSKTEQFVYGVINLRDSIYVSIPGVPPLHEAMSWFAPVRGWVVLSAYLYEENGKVIPHIMPLDILNTYWIPGSRGLLWACHQRYAHASEIKEEYEEDVKPDVQGRVLVYDVWDKDEEGVITGEKYLRKREHHAGHVPILILPGGATPLIQSAQYSDTIKDIGESWALNNRLLYDAESRMGSYLMTFAGKAAKNPMVHEFDSSKTGGKEPEFQGDLLGKGSVVGVDKGLGEALVPMIPTQLTRDAFAFFDFLKASLDTGDRAPVAYSQLYQPQAAAGMNLLRKLSELNLIPPKRLMERTYVWLAHELVSQYKSGGFKKMEVQGMDGSNRRFKFEVKPNEIDDSWQFEAQLLTDFPIDEMANVGMSVQLHETKLAPDQWIRDKLLHMEDVDLIEEISDREAAENIVKIKLRRIAKALVQDGDEEGAMFILEEIERTKQEKKPGVASQPGVSSAVSPTADVSAAQPQPPQASAFRRFLSRFGGQ